MMMEFESAHAYHPHVVKREQMDAPLNWHRGIPNMDQTNSFAMNGPGNAYAQSCGREANLNESYANESGNIAYGWTNGLGFSGNGTGQPMVLAEHNDGYQLENKGMVRATITALDYGDGSIQDDVGGDQRHTPDRNVGFAAADVIDEFLAAEFLNDNRSWEQPQPYPNLPNNNINAHATTSMADLSLAAFAPNLGLPNAEAGYSLPPQPLPMGLAISQVNFPPDNTYSQGGQDDETPQNVYTSITAQPYMENFNSNQAIEEWINPSYVGGSNVANLSNNGLDENSLVDSVDGLFTSEELGLSTRPRSTTTQSYGLLVPGDEFPRAMSSREASVSGAWESPGTQYGWESSSISPSPNPQRFVIPDSQLNGVLQNSMPTFGPQRTLNELMVNFDINTDPSSKKRKRKQFSSEGKKKVNLVRENGACVSCHARKISCATGGVCEGCIKTTGDPMLAKEICLRTKLKDIYKSVKDIHNTLDDRQRRLIPLLESLTGEPKSVDLTVANPRLGYKFQLRLQVMKCASSPSCRWKRLTKVNGIYVTRDVIQDQRYVIVPTSLPSIDEYDNFGRQILATSNGSHSGGLTQHLDEFLLGYCKNSQPSRLRQFANSTLRVASLSRLVAYGFLNLYDGSYDLLDRKTGISINENTVTRRYVSETVHDQLRILAAEGLEPVEHVVFAEIDDLNKHFGKVRNGRIVAGICVLRLMLLYRDRVIRDSIRLGLPRGGERHQKRLAKAAFMYKRLTIAYGTLCRESTPLIMSWEQENERDPTVEDLVMTNLFSMLQPAFEEFCNEKLTPEYDDLLKGLIIEASRIERRPSKKRKAVKVKEENGGCC